MDASDAGRRKHGEKKKRQMYLTVGGELYLGYVHALRKLENFVQETPLESDEDFGARLAEASVRVREISGIFGHVRQSLHRHWQKSPFKVLTVLLKAYRAMGSLVVRASDSSPEGLVSMPDSTKYHLSRYGVRAR
ncbi:hypothetical protein TNCV_1837751 [Trichonephila clavipes]|nr:hypothetical protein TNCV_1837751 [Trichonephila clavipes]